MLKIQVCEYLFINLPGPSPFCFPMEKMKEKRNKKRENLDVNQCRREIKEAAMSGDAEQLEHWLRELEIRKGTAYVSNYINRQFELPTMEGVGYTIFQFCIKLKLTEASLLLLQYGGDVKR